MTSFFCNIRKAALLALIGTVLGVIVPLWNALQSTFQTWSTPPLQPWRVPAVVILFLFSAIQPLFCYALCRSRGPLDISKELRGVSLIAAIAFGLIIGATLFQFAESVNSYSTAMRTQRIFEGGGHAANPFADASLSGLALDFLRDLSNLGYLALLIALWREEENPGDFGTPISSFLRIVTRIAVVTAGVGVALFLLRIPGAVYAHFSLREQALQNGVNLPAFVPQIAKFSQDAVSEACLFVAPLVVYKSLPRKNQVKPSLHAPPDQSEPDENHG